MSDAEATGFERVGAWLRRMSPFFGIALVGVAGWAVHRELAGTRWSDVWAEIDAIPPWRWAAAFGLTAVSYGVLALYEWVAARHVGLELPAWRVMLAGALGWAVSNTVGHSWLSGGALRMRLYSGWGVSGGDVARIVAFDSLTWVLGFATVGGLSLALDPPEPVAPWGRWVGLGLLVGLALAVAASHRRRTPIRIGAASVTLPRGPTLAAQIGLAAADNLAAIGALYVLFPPGESPSFPRTVSLFMVSALAGVLSGIPGGAGALDGALITLAVRYAPASVVVGAVLGWRLVYDLVPLGIAAVVLAGIELRRIAEPSLTTSELAATRPLSPAPAPWSLDSRPESGEPTRPPSIASLGTAGALGLRFTRAMAPPVLAALSFVGGLVLLISALSPADAERLRFLYRFEPLPVLETSHAASALVGVALLFVARGLWMRLGAAWTLLVSLSLLGGWLSLLKGLDVEEALFLLGVLAVAIPSRRAFYRRSALGRETLPLSWSIAVGVSVVLTGLVLLHTYVHVPWHGQAWWNLTLSGEASRSGRAFVLAVAMVSAAVVMSWLRPVRDPPPVPSEADRADAVRISVACGVTNGWLAALGDKALLFDPERTAFLMYGAAHGVWVCHAGPIGPPEAVADLLWTFREHADRAGARIALYEVRPELLPLCIDLGLHAYKFGEEALVPIAGFTLEGGANKGRRSQIARIEREGASFEVVPADGVPALLPELKEVSDRWLREKSAREKGFSLGYFDAGYLVRTPVAVVRREGRVVAFADVLVAPPELSVDLMRFHPDAPHGAMDYLFLSLFRWGSAQGLERFVLGMTPLGGLPDRDLAPLWARVGRFVFRNGEAFYNFQGLREYKEKFHPVWEPRYLAVQGSFALPATLRAINTLVSRSVPTPARAAPRRVDGVPSHFEGADPDERGNPGKSRKKVD